jgi:gas vesicle protein
MKDSDYDRDYYEHDNGKSGGSFFSGLLVGGLLGAAAGLLLAPQSGQRTRTMLRDKSLEVRDQVKHTAQETRERAEMLVEDTRSKAETLVEETKAKAEALQERGRDLIKTGKGRVEKTAEAAMQAAQETWEETGQKRQPARV